MQTTEKNKEISWTCGPTVAVVLQGVENNELMLLGEETRWEPSGRDTVVAVGGMQEKLRGHAVGKRVGSHDG